MTKKSLVGPILISIFAFIAVPVSVSAVTQKASQVDVCVDWDTKEIKYSKFWEKCPAKHTTMTLGSEGSSAYDIAVANGFVGTVDDWLTSLEGEDGSSSSGSRGATGATGPTGPTGPAGSGGGLHNLAMLYGSGSSSSSMFFTNQWTYYKMGFLVLDPGVYTVSLTLSAEKKTLADLNPEYPNNAYDVCSLFSAEYDPALDWSAQSFPNRAQIFTTDTSNADYSFPTSSFFNMDPVHEGYTDGSGRRVFNNHHSLSTIFSVSDTTKPTAVVVACTLEDDYGISAADASVSGYISATVISGGTVDLEHIGFIM